MARLMREPFVTRGRRRRSMFIAGAITIVAALAWSVIGAGATVSNPGSVGLTITNGTLTSSLGNIGPITGSFSNGTVTGAGALTFPQAGAAFDPFTVHVT